ncbi:Anoctamin-7 [Phlyctochytrium bullatum]|nr:Anoctamin-7 [Phlyctochytrium bullatum]
MTPVDGVLQLVYGVKRYDYILKFKLDTNASNAEVYRSAFEFKLLKRGLLIERELSLEDPSDVFVKILTPFHVLCTEAQLMKLKMRLKVDDEYVQKIRKSTTQSRSSLKLQSGPFFELWRRIKPLFEDDLGIEEQSAVFNRNRLHMFEGADPYQYSPRQIQSGFFRDSLRSLLTYRIIIGVEIPFKMAGKSRKEGLASLIILQYPFYTIAVYLNNWENYPTDTTYDDSFIVKSYIFDFANSYSQGRIRRHLEHSRRRKVSPEEPEVEDIEQAGSPKTPPMLHNVKSNEFVTWKAARGSWLIPSKRASLAKRSAMNFGTSVKNVAAAVLGKSEYPDHDLDDPRSVPGGRLPQYYRDDKLPEYTGVRDEYSQKVIQFGFVAMFVSINPLAPFFALLNNTYEIRADAYKLLVLTRRPVPARAQDIGSWEAIIRSTARLSVATNSVQIAFTSAAFHTRFLTPLPSAGARMALRVGFIIVFHYAVYIISSLIKYMIPEVPASVELAKARTAYLDRLQRDQDVEGEDEFLSNPSLHSERNFN